jgi:hypothetical protein
MGRAIQRRLSSAMVPAGVERVRGNRLARTGKIAEPPIGFSRPDADIP